MVGVVLAPLTERGLSVVDYLAEADGRLPGIPSAIRERPIQMRLDDLAERVSRIEDLKRYLAGQGS